jgi:hypothetical protein
MSGQKVATQTKVLTLVPVRLEALSGMDAQHASTPPGAVSHGNTSKRQRIEAPERTDIASVAAVLGNGFGARVAVSVLEKYAGLPKTGKPQPNEYTVLAGRLLVVSQSQVPLFGTRKPKMFFDGELCFDTQYENRGVILRGLIPTQTFLPGLHTVVFGSIMPKLLVRFLGLGY